MVDVQLSSTKATYYPASIQPGYMGAPPPVKCGYGSPSRSANISYFQNYRNENLSKMQMPRYEWGMTTTTYSPCLDIVPHGKTTNWNRLLHMPRSPISFLDAGRQQEVDDFYKVAQMHRDQYRDHAEYLHSLTYFKKADFKYQCSPDLTSTYIISPKKYVKYKDPAVLPTTLDRSYRSPPLPERALTGRYAPSSDMRYKR